MCLVIFLFAITTILTFVYFCQYNKSYWKKRGVKYHAKNKVLGPFWDYLTTRRPFFEVLGDLYKEYENEPAVGLGTLFTPFLFIRDVTNISHVLQIDFNSFYHRGFDNLEGDQLTESIVFMNGPKWKLLRQNMSPLFTRTKLKQMYYIIDKVAQDFVTYMKQDPSKLKGNAYDTITNYSSASITASVFGIGTKSMFDSPFVNIGRNATATSFSMNLKFPIVYLSPWLTRVFGIKIFTEYEDLFIRAIKQVLDEREKESVKRHDFADLALSIQKKGMMRDESIGCEMEPTVGLLSAQAFFFFIAGVTPSSTTLFCTLVELGMNPGVLHQVHKEIDETFENNDNNISYDIISKMSYIEKVLSESMRKFPPVGFLTRQCTQDTVLPVGNIKVAKGTKIFTPIFQIHHDPKYYPEPEKFDPERFAKDGQQPISDAFYMPFGKGARTCIGGRLALIQIKAGLVHLLRHFTVKTVNYDKIEFKKEMFHAIPINVDVQFISRDINYKH